MFLNHKIANVTNEPVLEAFALTMIPGIGVKGAVHLLETFGDARAVFDAPLDELTGRAELRPDLARAVTQRKGFAQAEKELRHCARNGLTVLASTDSAYPPLLHEIPDYPPVLYVMGDSSALTRRCLSMVGTRKATAYGQVVCSRLVEGLAERLTDLCIVSGLAFGIDAAAHRAAIAAEIPTVAVLANALPDITPAQHAALARDLLAHGGAIISEFSSQTPQKGTGYLARNRIIAGLSAGCVVVESPESGGSLHTAACADDYHRTVMAVPDRITDTASRGTNHLIYSHKAQLIQSAGDIIRELLWDIGPDAAALRAKPAAEPLTPEEERLLKLFPDTDPIAVEELVHASRLDLGALSALLVGLELSGAVRQLHGNRYLKLRRP